jgi:acid phosphatase (class A)
MRQYAYRLVFLLLLATATVAQAREPFYVGAAEFSLDRVLAPPPAADSQAQRDDLQAVLDLQHSRSDADIKDAQADAELSIFRFADVLGPEFRLDKLPFTAKFLRQALTDAGESSGAAKARFSRPRPYQASTEVSPVLPKPGNASYPSGHSTFGYTTGILLAIMVPEKSAELFDRAARYGRNRIVGGVHYPTDVEAGRICAAVVISAFLRNPKFQADLEQSRIEVRQALGLK